jgi:hypothetical protein
MQSATSFLLQDSRGNVGDNLMFWAMGGGYTSDLEKAERFSEDKAFSQNQSRASDVPWPLPYLEGLSRQVVDMQNLEAIAFPDDEGVFHAAAVPYRFVGNDVIFVANDGGETTDLSKAKCLTLEEAKLLNGFGQKVWPRSYLQGKARCAAMASRAKLKDALRGVTRILAKEPAAAVPRYRCYHCNIFMKATDYYGGPCPRCGGDNRP